MSGDVLALREIGETQIERAGQPDERVEAPLAVLGSGDRSLLEAGLIRQSGLGELAADALFLECCAPGRQDLFGGALVCHAHHSMSSTNMRQPHGVMFVRQPFGNLGLAFALDICVQCIFVDPAEQRSLGRAIRRAREDAGLTQVQLGDQANLDQAKLSKYENGHHEPPLSALLRIDEACKQPRGYVLRLAQLIHEPGTGEQAIASDARLQPDHRGALVTLYRLAVDSRRDDDEVIERVSKGLDEKGTRRPRRRRPAS